MRVALLFMSIIGLLAGHPHAAAQQVSTTAPPAPQQSTATPDLSPDLSQVPLATPLPPVEQNRASIDSDTQSRHGDLLVLAGDVVITYRGHIVRADTISYNEATGELDAQGHLRVSGGENDEYIQASHGTYNLKTSLGRFYDVQGSVHLHAAAGGARPQQGLVTQGLVSPNPFLFFGRMVVKTGPDAYDIYDGSVTSCLMPRPDWLLSAGHLAIGDGEARASNTVFRLLGVPVLFLPYVTHPTDTERRQSGLLIPELGDSSSKGIILGDQFYLALGRSADLTLGLEYFSLRGFAESGTFRLRGRGDDFFNAHFSALQDRGYTPEGGVYTNQGGQDVTASFRRQLAPNTRAVADIEYLSSYVYREAFTENFNEAVSSDITSIGYVTREADGFALDVRADRYQGLKRVPVGDQPGEEVHIFHAPSVDATALDRNVPGTPLVWSFTGSAAALKRAQPDFTSSGMTERLDLHPELALPFGSGGWHVLASVGVRETVYSRSQQPTHVAGGAPVEVASALNRADVEFEVAIRPPVLERTFAVPARLQHLLGTEVRHTIEPELTYRDVRGVNNFLSVLRFDQVDLASDTNQLEYGVTQHLYFRPREKKKAAPDQNCIASSAQQEQSSTGEAQSETQSETQSATTMPDVLNPSAASTDANGIPNASAEAPDEPIRTHGRGQRLCPPAAPPAQREWFSWRLTQRYFFDPTFGDAVVTSRRNIFDATLSLSGIAFLTEPRNISPLISRMRLRTSGHTDAEWDFDYDTGASKFTSSNVFLDAHEGPVFGGFSYALLNAPGRFSTEIIDTNNNNQGTLLSSPVSNFRQMRVLLGYGNPVRPGLAVAANAGVDLKLGSVQYGALQTSYNWNCCGFSVEYRKYELGSVRNENVYRFNFTLANIGSAGNLRRAERLF